MATFDPATAAAMALALAHRTLFALWENGLLTIEQAQRISDGAAQDAEGFIGPAAQAHLDDLTAALGQLRGLPPLPPRG